MNIHESDITKLKVQIDEWSREISFLDLKYHAATEVALKYANQLETIHTKHKNALLKLHDLEQHAHGSYMWENIGDGG